MVITGERLVPTWRYGRTFVLAGWPRTLTGREVCIKLMSAAGTDRLSAKAVHGAYDCSLYLLTTTSTSSHPLAVEHSNAPCMPSRSFNAFRLLTVRD